MDESEVSSLGSDIDVGNVGDFDDYQLDGGLCGDPLDQAQFGDSDDEDEVEFFGFHQDWTETQFQPNYRAPFRGYPGPKALHPQYSRAVDYFYFFYDVAMWERLVTGGYFC